MKLIASTLLLLAACAGDQAGGGPDAGPAAPAGLDRCADDGVGLSGLWDVDNLHGAMLALAIAPDGTAVVTTEDGAVKQWTLGATADAAPLPGGKPSYGDPFTEEGTAARALAIGGAGDRVLAGAGAALHQWSIPDAGDLGATPLEGGALTAVAAVDADRAVVADDSFGGAIRVVTLDGGAAGEALPTALWGVAALRTGG
ncbi:MAG TPA: hypothetical protein VL172_16450, partial [Kofleriaceae bacterium]|nr:hypothetical protein [Kofleriaceae bacterium]